MSTVLIDTDVAIDYLRGLSYAQPLLASLWGGSNCFLSILSAYELFAGMQPQEASVTHDFIAACCLEPIDLSVTQRAAQHYQQHRKKGLTLTTVDCLIYATAILRGHKIATRNLKHYPDKTILFKLD